MKVTRVSPMSGSHTMELDVTQAQLDEFFGPKPRRLIQDIFPNLSPVQREFIQTGYTAEDWAKMFPPEDA